MIDTHAPETLADELLKLARAMRLESLASVNTPGFTDTSTNPGTGATASAPFDDQSLIHQAFAATAAGDNELIPPGGQLRIMQLVLWNTTLNTITLQDGPSPNGQKLLRMTGFPANSNYTLGYTGQAHMEVSAGNAFVLKLSDAGLVDGYCLYRSL